MATSLTALDADIDAAYAPAVLTPFETTDGQGRKFIEVHSLADDAAEDVDVETISTLLGSPDTAQIQTDLRALEAAAGQLFAIESGQAPGLKREVYSATAPSDRAKLMLMLGFNLTDNETFIGPAKVIDVPALAQCRLGLSIQTRCNLSAMRTGRLLLYLAAIFALMGAARSPSAYTSKKSKAMYEALAGGAKTLWLRTHPCIFCGFVRHVTWLAAEWSFIRASRSVLNRCCCISGHLTQASGL